MSERPVIPTIGFVLEQTLGHVAHSDNLRNLVPHDERIVPAFASVPFEVDGWAARVPGYSNWTIRAGVRAAHAIRSLERRQRIGALFIHTQVPAVLAGRSMRRIPTVVSVDATPIQFDQFGALYAHDRSSDRVERVKWRLNRDAFARAAHVVSWSEWSKHSLIEHYEVPESKITVLAPGVDVAKWSRPSRRAGQGLPVKILFVGGDLPRKGGSLLIDAVRRMRLDGHRGAADLELHLVTNAAVSNEPGIVVHRGLRPNSPELIGLYHSADVFCLPTLADCLPMVLSEAGAAGLPLVSTAVGAIPELVRDGETGLVVEAGSVDALVGALTRLVGDAGLRSDMGEKAAALVNERFDAGKNSRRIIDILTDLVCRSGGGQT